MEIETDKTTVGVPSPAHGIIEEIFVADGDTVKSGQQLFKLKVTGEAPAAKPASAPVEAPKPAAAAPPPPPPRPAVRFKNRIISNHFILRLFLRLKLPHRQLPVLVHPLLHQNHQLLQQLFQLQPFVMHRL